MYRHTYTLCTYQRTYTLCYIVVFLCTDIFFRLTAASIVAHSQDRRETISRSPPVFDSACGKRLISHARFLSRSFTLSAIPIAPKVAPSLIEEKLALLCRGLIILRNVLGPRARKRGTRGRRLQNFIVCHAEINNKTDLISYDLYNIFLKARRYLSCRAQVYAYVYVYRVYELCVYFYQVYITSVYVCTCIPRLYAIRVLHHHLHLPFYICILGSLTRAFSRLQPSISLPYIQYVKIYRLDVI